MLHRLRGNILNSRKENKKILGLMKSNCHIFLSESEDLLLHEGGEDTVSILPCCFWIMHLHEESHEVSPYQISSSFS